MCLQTLGARQPPKSERGLIVLPDFNHVVQPSGGKLCAGRIARINNVEWTRRLVKRKEVAQEKRSFLFVHEQRLHQYCSRRRM